jgi:outer membrane protein OmpA-like peptidoglycan-associated protein
MVDTTRPMPALPPAAPAVTAPAIAMASPRQANPAQPTVAAPLATLLFQPQSASLSAETRASLQRAASTMKTQRLIEVRSYATGTDPGDARKLALARALAVRSYLIDLGVSPKMDIAGEALPADGADHVDIVVGGSVIGDATLTPFPSASLVPLPPRPAAPPATAASIAPPAPAPPPVETPRAATRVPAGPSATPDRPAAAPLISITFARLSAEISGPARAELARIATTLKGARHQIEVHGYASGGDAADDRKVALARALAVRSYLIDLGVNPRMDVASTALPASGDGNTEHVDIVVQGR